MPTSSSSNPTPNPSKPCSSSGCDGQQSCSTGASPEPIRYADGQIVMNTADLSSLGFGSPWGHRRS